MKKITMLLLASFFIFACSNSKDESYYTDEGQIDSMEVMEEEIGPSDNIKNGIEQIEYIVRTGDFSQLNALIEQNPNDYTLILTRAAAKKRIGDVDGANEDYDFALKNFDLPQADIEIIEAQKNSKEDVLKQYYQDQDK